MRYFINFLRLTARVHRISAARARSNNLRAGKGMHERLNYIAKTESHFLQAQLRSIKADIFEAGTNRMIKFALLNLHSSMIILCPIRGMQRTFLLASLNIYFNLMNAAMNANSCRQSVLSRRRLNIFTVCLPM